MRYPKFSHVLPLVTAILGLAALVPMVTSAADVPEAAVPTETRPEDTVFHVRVEINTPPEKLLYRVGETLDTVGLTLDLDESIFGTWGVYQKTVVYDEYTETLRSRTDPKEKLSVSGFDSSEIGIRRLNIGYGVYDPYDNSFVWGNTELSVTVTDIGDIDLDGSYSANDLRVLTEYLHGKAQLTADAVQNADMNGDGETDVFDLGLLKQKCRTEAVECMELTPTIQKDVTNAVEAKFWNTVCLSEKSYSHQKTKVIENSDHLKSFTASLYPAVQRSLLKTYDDAFFRDNVLILHYDLQHYDLCTTEIADISYKDHKLTITAEQVPSEKRTNSGIQIWQIAVPRSQYNGNGAAWTEKNTEFIKAGYRCFDLELISAENRFQYDFDAIWMQRNQEKKIQNFSDLKTYSETIFDEKGAEWLQEQFPERFFETQSVCFIMTDALIGTQFTCWQTKKMDNTVIADVRTNESFGCEAGAFLNAVTFEKELDAEHFELRVTTIPQSDRAAEGSYNFFGNDSGMTLLVNTYSFHDEKEIALYWAYPVGNAPYAGQKLIQSFAVSEDCSDFSVPCDVTDIVSAEEMPDDTRVWENVAEGYRIVWSTDSVLVRFLKSKSTGEWEQIEIPCPKYPY